MLKDIINEMWHACWGENKYNTLGLYTPLKQHKLRRIGYYLNISFLYLSTIYQDEMQCKQSIFCAFQLYTHTIYGDIFSIFVSSLIRRTCFTR